MLFDHKAVLNQHCYAIYRRPIFEALLAGETGVRFELWFGKNPFHSKVKTYDTIEEIPLNPKISQDQYRMLNNKWITKGRLLWQKELLNALLDHKVKYLVLEGSPWHISTWALLILSMLTNKRVGLWSHGSKTLPKGLKRIFLRLFFSLADFVLLYGFKGWENLTAIGISKKKIYPVHNSLDYENQVLLRDSITSSEIDEFRRQCFSHPEAPIFLWLGRIHSRRQLGILIDAASLLHARGTPVNILLAGPVSEETEGKALRTLVERHGLCDYIKFYGPSYNEKTNVKLFAMAIATVSPGPIGLTCIHSLTYATPVITSDLKNCKHGPEIDAIIPRITGDFFESGNADSLAKIMTIWINKSLEEKKQLAKITDKIIRERFSVRYQLKVIKDALHGIPPSGWEWKKTFTD